MTISKGTAELIAPLSRWFLILCCNSLSILSVTGVRTEKQAGRGMFSNEKKERKIVQNHLLRIGRKKVSHQASAPKESKIVQDFPREA
jgi:hypothetical protein